MIIDKLIDNILQKEAPVAVGLDTRLEYIPDSITKHYIDKDGKIDFAGASDAIIAFNRKIIDALYDLIPAVKIQIAYYEMYGIEGIRAFKETSAYARDKGLIVISDIKRNDINTTAAAYSAAYIGRTPLPGGDDNAFDSDFITVNPYFGTDGISPFIADCKRYGKGLFILVKTSNPSSGEIQDLVSEGRRIYEIVADKVSEWGSNLKGKYGYSSVGAVVGATYPEQGIALRKRMPGIFFLVPGYGAQGARVEDIAGCFDDKGLGALINASRSVICAYKRDAWKDKYKLGEFDAAARAEVLKMKTEIDRALSAKGSKPW
jgi:orotidine-5'-phosphate decarboxylase